MQSINQLIMNITEGARAAHAFIIEGRAGDARASLIGTLAAGLECTSAEVSARPCGKCPACRQAAAGTSMDIVHMAKSPSAGKSGRETYKVDNAAEFIERLSMGSYGRFLVGIIDDADSLSETIQNKLLKTLEEPAPDTVILLAVSNRDNLLSTVRSRCSDIRVSDYLEEETEGAEENEAGKAAIAGLAGMMESGSPFCEFRAALDKAVKTREDALIFLAVLEDALREKMLHAADRAGSVKFAESIEKVNICRMDIKREMNHSRALKRLYLEVLHTW